MIRSLIAVVIFVAFAMNGVIYAHSGGLDARGGHHDRKNGGYHYHRSGNRFWGGPRARRFQSSRLSNKKGSTNRISQRERLQERPIEKIAEEDLDEIRAFAKLRIAKQFIEKRQIETAKKWLREIVNKYSHTTVSGDANELLIELGDDQ